MRMPIRKPGKNARDMQDPNITLEKYNKLKSSLKRLIEVDRPPAIIDVKDQAAFGDFSDNAAYSIAKGKLRSINYRILKIKGYLKDAVLIDKKNNGTVELGSNVTVEQTKFACASFVPPRRDPAEAVIDGLAESKNIKKYKILGSAEVDVSKGIISQNSPIGSALIGKKKGDVFNIILNEKNIEFKIIDIK